MSYNANDRKQIREAKRTARQDDRARQATISSIMSTNLGRQYIYNLLTRCHVFSSSFNTNALSMAFSEGERNVGLALVADIMPICADQYTVMTREAYDRSIAADSRTSAHESDDTASDEDRVDASGYPDEIPAFENRQ